ncbi:MULTISPECIES: phosphoenolpyruvate--protein phosphotransferase [unclassified Rhodanobacter]|jgi:phosphotransferase system enzyme I (PtsI)|uniref:phosphoenolpyruvate--protein phosphotransferase n=1 Tax=unclassified Rhodanobacter TaxID=2621553 RepID=UPI00160936F0|nr:MULTISPECIES: phosphoenolpyruvate--protein phosphotransferase [unclassified Rhodanobacter]MBB6241625.1 phosphotransferase system enzyme I (PtsI) [Rhodanobacter sp. MP1X3]MBB6249333.1 phosphotransferase system enzyme I (PtsI) [Rhodanobacter sp. A1T4]
MRHVLSGTIAAHGMALGRARLVQPSRYSVDTRPLAEDEVEEQIELMHRALDTARQELRELRGKLHGALAREVNEFIDAHSLLLDDGELLRGLDDMVRIGHYRPGAALKKQRDRLSAVFEAMDDPYLRSRKEDIEQVINRVISALQRQTSPEERKLAARVGEILIADSIAPGDMAQLAGNGLLGVVGSSGSPYSHSAILARSLGLPMLVGTRDALSNIHDDDLILLDAERGEAVVHPNAQDLSRYRAWQRDAAIEGRRLAMLANAPTRTRDGIEICLLANAESANDVAAARARGADGVGLYRTEFLFLRHKGLPSEDEQFIAYRDLVMGMGGLPVTIRTLDLGADKADAAGLVVRGEENPALGVRGVRLSLRYPAVFTTQIRAILRAACYGPVRVLVPMVTQPDELIAVRTLFRLARQDLKRENVDLPEKLPLGAMIEVPAAAINVRALLEYSDFLAIGTNDLAQYVLAADRGNDALENIYNPLQPALLRLLSHVISAGRRAKKPVSLCGEIAGDVNFTALLLVLGLCEFSMHPTQILLVRDRLATLDHAHLRRQASRLLRAHTHEQAETLMNEILGACIAS